MNSTSRILVILTGLSFYLGTTALTAAATSEINNARTGIRLTATLPMQLKLSVAEVNLDMRVDDVAQNSVVTAIPVTSSWVLNSSISKVEMVGYFDSPAMALCDKAGHAVPADHLVGGISHDAMLPFIEASRIRNNASRTFFRQDISPTNAVGSRKDTLQIQLNRIDDLGLPPAEYSGILHLRLVSY